MPKIAYNTNHGKFSLSHEAIMFYAKLANINIVPIKNSEYSYDYYVNGIIDDGHYFYHYNIERTDPFLIETIEQLGDKANCFNSKIKIKYLPEGTKYFINGYGGYETIVTEDDIIWKIA